MAVKPLDDRVLVKQSEAEERTAGGIVLPDTAKEKPQRGSVIAVGRRSPRESSSTLSTSFATSLLALASQPGAQPSS